MATLRKIDSQAANLRQGHNTFDECEIDLVEQRAADEFTLNPDVIDRETTEWS